MGMVLLNRWSRLRYHALTPAVRFINSAVVVLSGISPIRKNFASKRRLFMMPFVRLGGFSIAGEEGAREDAVLMEPILGCNVNGLSPLYYRNKAQYPLGVDRNGKACAGFYARRSHRIIPCDQCMIQDEMFAPVVQTLVQSIDRLRIPVYSEETHQGFLRHLFLRSGRRTGELMVCRYQPGRIFLTVRSWYSG